MDDRFYSDDPFEGPFWAEDLQLFDPLDYIEQDDGWHGPEHENQNEDFDLIRPSGPDIMGKAEERYWRNIERRDVRQRGRMGSSNRAAADFSKAMEAIRENNETRLKINSVKRHRLLAPASICDEGHTKLGKTYYTQVEGYIYYRIEGRLVGFPVQDAFGVKGPDGKIFYKKCKPLFGPELRHSGHHRSQPHPPPGGWVSSTGIPSNFNKRFAGFQDSPTIRITITVEDVEAARKRDGRWTHWTTLPPPDSIGGIWFDTNTDRVTYTWTMDRKKFNRFMHALNGNWCPGDAPNSEPRLVHCCAQVVFFLLLLSILIAVEWAISHAAANKLMHSLNGNARGDTGSDRGEAKCFLCHQKGHIKRNCPRNDQTIPSSDEFELCHRAKCTDSEHYHSKPKEGPKSAEVKPGAERRIAEKLARSRLVLCVNRDCLSKNNGRAHYHPPEYNWLPATLTEIDEEEIGDMERAEEEPQQVVVPDEPAVVIMSNKNKRAIKRQEGANKPRTPPSTAGALEIPEYDLPATGPSKEEVAVPCATGGMLNRNPLLETLAPATKPSKSRAPPSVPGALEIPEHDLPTTGPSEEEVAVPCVTGGMLNCDSPLKTPAPATKTVSETVAQDGAPTPDATCPPIKNDTHDLETTKEMVLYEQEEAPLTYTEMTLYTIGKTKSRLAGNLFLRIARFAGLLRSVYNTQYSDGGIIGTKLTSAAAHQLRVSVMGYGIYSGPDVEELNLDVMQDAGFTHAQKVEVCQELYDYIIVTADLQAMVLLDRNRLPLDAPLARVIRRAGDFPRSADLIRNTVQIQQNTACVAYQHFLKMALLRRAIKPESSATPDFR